MQQRQREKQSKRGDFRVKIEEEQCSECEGKGGFIAGARRIGGGAGIGMQAAAKMEGVHPCDVEFP